MMIFGTLRLNVSPVLSPLIQLQIIPSTAGPDQLLKKYFKTTSNLQINFPKQILIWGMGLSIM